MRKKTTNKKVLQAISIGLSAMIAVTSMPVDAIAAEVETIDPPLDPVVDDTNTTATDEANAAQQAAVEAISPIDDAVGATVDAAAAVDGAQLNTTDTADPDDVTKLQNAAKAITGGDGKGGEQSDLASPSEEIAAPDPGDGIHNDLGDAELYGGAADAATGVADGQVGVIVKESTDIKNNTESAINNLSAGIGAINNSTSIDGANSAYNTLQTQAQTASDDFDKALGDYKTLLDDYNKQLDRIADLEAAFKTEIDAAKAGADAIAAFDKDGNPVSGELVEAKKKADALKVAADDALANLNQNAKNMLELDKLIEAHNDDDGVYWGSDKNQENTDGVRQLVKKAMLYYYLPKAGIITYEELASFQADENNYDKDGNFLIDNIIKTVDSNGGSGKDTKTYHYIDINGKQYYYNCFLNGSGTDITIFEKREVERKSDSEIEYDGFDQYKGKDNNGQEIILTQDELQQEIANGTIVEVEKDGKKQYVKINADGTEVTFAHEVGEVFDETETTKSVVNTISTETPEVTYEMNDQNQLVMVVKKDATVVKYVKTTETVSKTITATELTTYSSNDAAFLAAVKAGITDTTIDQESIVATGVTSEASQFQTTGTYTPVFKYSVDLKKDYENFGWKEGWLGIKYYWYRDADEAEDLLAGISKDFYKGEVNKAAISGELKNTSYDVGKAVYGETESSKGTPELLDGKWFWYWHTKMNVTMDYTKNGLGNLAYTGTAAATEAEAKQNFINGTKDLYGGYKANSTITATNATEYLLNGTISYWQQTGTEDVQLSTTTVYEKSSALKGSIIQNKIYKDYEANGTYHESLMSFNSGKTATDENGDIIDLNRGLTAELTDAKNLHSKYKALVDQANTAVAAYEEAFGKVEAISKAIEIIPKRESNFFRINLEDLTKEQTPQELMDYLESTLKEYQFSIIDGELYVIIDDEPVFFDKEIEEKYGEYERELLGSIVDLWNAANNMNRKQGILREAEDVLRDTIRRLTPPSTPTGETTPGTPTTPGGTTPTVVTLTAPAVPLATIPSLTAGAAGVVAGVGAGAAGAVVDAAAGAIADAGVVIPDAEVPLAAPTVDPSTTKTGSEKLTDIDDMEVPLADDFDQSKVNWWWLLLVAVLGASGAEAYRRKHNKKKAMAADITESNEEK